MPLPWWTSSSSTSPYSQQQQQQQQQRRLTRAKQLRHLRHTDVNHLDFFLNSPSSSHRHRRDRDSTASPQPLPLPDLSALFASGDRLFKVKSKNSRDRFRLPSPTGAPSPGGASGGGGSRSCKERESQRLRSNDRDNSDDRSIITSNNARIAPRDSQVSIDDQRRVDARSNVDAQRGAGHQRNIHRAETWSSTCLQQSVKSEEQVRENFTPNVAFRSAPASKNVSPMLSPQRVSNGEPFPFFPLESKPLFDPATTSTFPFSTPPRSNLVSCPASPIHSTQVKNSAPPLNRISRSVSPRRPKLSIEISSINHDNNSVPPNVHPLPLPPTPHSLGQTSPVPQVAAMPEFLCVKSQWSKGKLIGRGTFGSVYVATNRETGALCAMKEVELLPDDPKSAECMRQLEQEIKVLSDLKHPNIVQYYGSEIVDDRFYIYLEYVYPGSINKYVRDHCGAMTEAVVRNFTRHILSGLAYLHSRKTVHRDIKGANLLVDACGVVKLADFGMAKHLSGQAADLSLKGSPYWMAPELMNAVMQKDNNVDQAFAVDIWSLGCTIIEMLTGNPPWSGFEGAAAMFKVLRESPPIPETFSPEGKDFLSCCFRRNPADRPPANKLLDHPFLRNSQLQDISSSNLLNFSNPIEKTYSPKELYDHKIDKFPMSPNRYTTNGKGGNNENCGLLPHHPEASEQAASSRHSPRSILDPLSSNLSPPRSSPTLKLLIPGNSSNGFIGGTVKNVVSPKLWT